jgi:hypothetical protein
VIRCTVSRFSLIRAKTCSARMRLLSLLNLNPDEGVGVSADREELGSTPKVGPWKAKSTPRK